jgi:predicted dehydrogenase
MIELNIGVIGLGNIGQKHCEALKQIRQTKILAVLDINSSVLTKTASALNATPYTDLEKLLQHPGLEAVLIALPDQLHRDAAVLAAQAGKHILVEKPMPQLRRMHRT